MGFAWTQYPDQSTFWCYWWSWCCHISHTVIRILDSPDHVEMNKDTFPCLEAIDTATIVDMASSHHPVTHHDTTVCAEKIVVVIDVASDVASLEPVTRIIDNNPEPVAFCEETISYYMRPYHMRLYRAQDIQHLQVQHRIVRRRLLQPTPLPINTRKALNRNTLNWAWDYSGNMVWDKLQSASASSKWKNQWSFRGIEEYFPRNS